MLVKIPLLSLLLFGITYPLCFWLSFRDPIQHHFHRFHLGCPALVGGLAVGWIWFLPLSQPLKNFGLIWLMLFFFLTAFYWKKTKVNLWIISFLVLYGIKLYANLCGQWLAFHPVEIAVSLLDGLIVSATFYAMNLGHFYLNVHGLKINHLKNAVQAFILLVILRLIWDIYSVQACRVMDNGEEIKLVHFLLSTDGLLLWVALFFGTLFPFGASYFAFGTLKLKNTQATTGILYVILAAVLLGDLAYKYYLLKYGIAL